MPADVPSGDGLGGTVAELAVQRIDDQKPRREAQEMTDSRAVIVKLGHPVVEEPRLDGP